jgi:hypothetical protein
MRSVFLTSVLRTARALHADDSGQTIIVVVLALGLFLLAFIGFATDATNLWFHRQAAQGAADAACQAGGMDLLLHASGNPTPVGPGFTPGTAFTCADATKANSGPCFYANANGYNGSGLVAGADSNSVSVTFPASVSGVATLPGTYNATAPYIKVELVDRVRTFFMPLATGSKTQDVRASAQCGLVPVATPIPIVILHPSASGALSVQGTPSVAIIGGPKKSVQVNSVSTTAVSMGGSASVDLSQGGPSLTGGNFAVFGGPSTKPSQLLLGSGSYVYPGSPDSDPYATISKPTVPAAGTVTAVAYGVSGCPDPDGCALFTGGYYSSGISIPYNISGNKKTAIFSPGLYYLNGDLQLGANSTVRPSSEAGDGSGGATFYFTGSSTSCPSVSGAPTLCVTSNSGSRTSCSATVTNNCVWDYVVAGSGGLPAVDCPGGASVVTLPTQLSGNVLLGPCSGTYGDPGGAYRGFLFFQDRATAANPSWGGGGGFLSAGLMYFHQCKSDGTGTNCSAPGSGGYGTTLTMSGGSSGSSYAIGNVVTDKMSLTGTSGLSMVLNPSSSFSLLKVQMLQ